VVATKAEEQKELMAPQPVEPELSQPPVSFQIKPRLREHNL
jgi:hypothetical protein